MTTNTNANFEIRVEVKKKRESNKRNRWPVKLSIDVSTLGRGGA